MLSEQVLNEIRSNAEKIYPQWLPVAGKQGGYVKSHSFETDREAYIKGQTDLIKSGEYIKASEAWVWVKASERLPEPNVTLGIRLEGKIYSGYMRNYGNNLFFIDNKIPYQNQHPNNIEWLCPPTQVKDKKV